MIPTVALRSQASRTKQTRGPKGNRIHRQRCVHRVATTRKASSVRLFCFCFAASTRPLCTLNVHRLQFSAFCLSFAAFGKRRREATTTGKTKKKKQPKIKTKPSIGLMQRNETARRRITKKSKHGIGTGIILPRHGLVPQFSHGAGVLNLICAQTPPPLISRSPKTKQTASCGQSAERAEKNRPDNWSIMFVAMNVSRVHKPIDRRS